MTLEVNGTTAASYSPGSWLAMAGRRTWLLANLDPMSEVVAALRGLLNDDAGHLEVLDTLSRGGLRQVPSFAMVSLVEADTVILVRGEATARVGAGPDAELTTASGRTTWVERRYTGAAEHVELVAEPDALPGDFPFSGGVVRAARLVLHLAPDDRHDDVAPRDDAPRDVVQVQEDVPEPPPPPPDPAEPYAGTSDAAGGLPDDQEPEPPPPATSAPPMEVDRPAQPRVSQLIEEVPWASAASPSGPATPAQPVAIPAGPSRLPSVLPLPAFTPTPTPFRPASAAPPPQAAPAAPVDIDELTITRDAHWELLHRDEAMPLPPGPTVHAVHCGQGHPNPANAVRCRVCNEGLPQVDPVTIPRPVLGVLSMSTGEAITLDRGVLMGRSPDSARLVGGERPHLVRVPSPDKDISRNHLEVRLDGWHVIVTDLNSTNGTFVTLPQREPQRLLPDFATPIEPGTVVSLSDEVTFRYEVAE